MTVFISCSNSRNSENSTEEISLIGKWKLIEARYSDGGSNPPIWTPITNGYVLTLNKDLSFTSTQIIECINGTYTNLNGKITLLYACGNNTIPNQFIVLSNSKTEMIIKNINCIEDCADKFKKIN